MDFLWRSVQRRVLRPLSVQLALIAACGLTCAFIVFHLFALISHFQRELAAEAEAKELLARLERKRPPLPRPALPAFSTSTAQPAGPQVFMFARGSRVTAPVPLLPTAEEWNSFNGSMITLHQYIGSDEKTGFSYSALSIDYPRTATIDLATLAQGYQQVGVVSNFATGTIQGHPSISFRVVRAGRTTIEVRMVDMGGRVVGVTGAFPSGGAMSRGFLPGQTPGATPGLGATTPAEVADFLLSFSP